MNVYIHNFPQKSPAHLSYAWKVYPCSFSEDSHCSFFIPVLSAPAWWPTKSAITRYGEQGGNAGLFIHQCVLFAYIYQQRQEARKSTESNGTCSEPSFEAR